MPTETPPTTLYAHQAHPHTPRNVNEQHAAEHTGFNDRLAITLTKASGSMWCAYLFAGIGVGSLVGVITNNLALALVCGAVSSYFLQLVFLPILQKGQALLGRHGELQSTETHANTERLLHEFEQMRRHLDAQDAELIGLRSLLMTLQPNHTPPVVVAPTPAPIRGAKGRFVSAKKVA
jgi:hypothetical protein